ncbi:MAG: D-cysteine desulfhydrase family protein [Chloroflexi bacterium]|nr:D-cysteine desulfhydrase family protein [Chloroflexota bacterium]
MKPARVLFAHLPTPIEEMPRLTASLGGPKIFCKRDDQTGLAFGGNKARKLEFLLAEAQANGAKTLITVGAIQSNHCRQTAALAAKFGFRCILVLSGDPPRKENGNLLLDRLFGADIVWTNRQDLEITSRKVFQQSWEKGDRPYLIPLGGSTPIGALGFAEAMKELAQQNMDVNWIVVASSSGGTQAGMVLGARLCHWTGKILGISIDHTAQILKKTVAQLANGAAERIDSSFRFTPEEILINDQYLGGGYAVAGAVEIEAIGIFAKKEGIVLDPVYTARAAGGMIDLIREGFFGQDDRILFWHTGGGPAIFADPYADLFNK